MKKLLALLTAAVAAVTSASADVVAQWSGNLANGATAGANDKYVMSITEGNSNISFSQGKATLTATTTAASTGLEITWPNPAEDTEVIQTSAMTVFVKYSNLAPSTQANALICANWGTSEVASYILDNKTRVGIAYDVSTTDCPNQDKVAGTVSVPTEGILMLSMAAGSNADLKAGTRVAVAAKNEDGTYGAFHELHYRNNVRWATAKFRSVKIGGAICPATKLHRPGMTVEAVEIHNAAFSVAEATTAFAPNAPAVARIAETEVEYSTLSAALSAATSGQTVELLGNLTDAANIPQGVTLKTSKTAKLTGTLTGGNGTFIFDAENTNQGSGVTVGANWRGTFWLKNRTYAEQSPDQFGNANSTVKYTNVIGYVYRQYDGTVNVEDGEETLGLEISDGSSGWLLTKVIRFGHLTGTGTLKTSWGNIYPLHIKSVAGFTGTINTANANGIGVILGSGSGTNGALTADDLVPQNAGKGKVTVVNAEINSNFTVTTGITGSGTIVINNVATQLPLANTWTGTVKLPVIVASGLNLNAYGNSNSKVEIAGVNGGWLVVPQGTIYIYPTLVLNGEFRLDAYSPRTYQFTGIEGEAAFSVIKKDGQGSPSAINISTVDQAKFSGAIKSANGSTLTITTLKTTLDELPSEKTKVVTIAEGSTDNIVVTAATFADGTEIDSDKISVESDGIYVIVAASTSPTTWEDVKVSDLAETDLAGISSEGLTALKTWAQGTGNVAIDDIALINVDCFLMGVANAEEAPELNISAEDLAKILAAENLEAAAAALKETYPNATVTVKDVTTKICGEGATNTHLYQLELSLPTAE